MSTSLRVREYENFTRRMREPEGRGNASHAVSRASGSVCHRPQNRVADLALRFAMSLPIRLERRR